MKKIIILEKVLQTNYFEVRCLFWLAVPAKQQTYRVDTTIVSQFKGISATELQDLKDGKVFEIEYRGSYPSNASNNSIASDLQSKYAIEQTKLNNDKKFNLYGSYWDGTSWTMGGV